MPASKIQDFLSRLDKHAIASEMSGSSGDPWGGYTRAGFVVYYQNMKKNYRWEALFDNGLSESVTATYFFSREELIIHLEKQDWQYL